MPRRIIIDHFWENYKEDENGCWIWKKCIHISGYGNLRVEGKTKKAHRVSFELKNGPIPEGMDVLHKCDVRSCINPDHLYLGTDKENAQDREDRGRGGAKHEKHGMTNLSWEDINKMRSLYKTGEYTQTEIGKKFGVKKSQASNILGNRQWIK